MTTRFSHPHAKRGTVVARDWDYGVPVVRNSADQIVDSRRRPIYEASDRNEVTRELNRCNTTSVEQMEHQPFKLTNVKEQKLSNADFRRNISFNKLAQHYQRQTDNIAQVPRPKSNYVSSSLQASRSMTDLRSVGTPPLYGYFISEVPDEFELKISSKAEAHVADVKNASCGRRTVDYSASKGVAALRASFEERSLKAKEAGVPVKPKQICSSSTTTGIDGRLATHHNNSRSQSLPRGNTAVQKSTLANGSPMTSSSGYESRSSTDLRSTQKVKAFSQKDVIEDKNSSTSSVDGDPTSQRFKELKEPFTLNRWNWDYNAEVAMRHEKEDSLNQKYADFISLLEAKYAHVPANDEPAPIPIANQSIRPILRSQHFQGVYSSPDGITRWLVDVNAKGHDNVCSSDAIIDEEIVQKKYIPKSSSNYSFPSESSTPTRCCTTITVALSKPVPLIKKVEEKDEEEIVSVVESPIIRSYAPRKVFSSAPQFAHLGYIQKKFSREDDTDSISDCSFKQPVESLFDEDTTGVYLRQQENLDPQCEAWKSYTNSEVVNCKSPKIINQRPSSFHVEPSSTTQAGRQEPSWTSLAKQRSSNINCTDSYKPKRIASQEPSWTALAKQRSAAANAALRQRNSEPEPNRETSPLNFKAKEWIESAKRLAYSPTKDYGCGYDNEDYCDSD